MGKRSNYERKPRDFYPTPWDAVVPLFKHLPKGTRFIEPMAGDGRLALHLERAGHKCVYASDLEPQEPYNGMPLPFAIEKRDVLFFDDQFNAQADMIITNPPWTRELLHPAIDRFTAEFDTWLLFDADWKYTAQAKPFKDKCRKVVSVGRISWEGNGVSGMDNCAWYLFSKEASDVPTQFFFPD